MKKLTLLLILLALPSWGKERYESSPGGDFIIDAPSDEIILKRNTEIQGDELRVNRIESRSGNLTVDPGASNQVIFSQEAVFNGGTSGISVSGLSTVEVTVTGTTPDTALFATGNHYVVNMSSASGDTNVTLTAGATNATLLVTLINNSSSYNLNIAADGSEKILYGSVQYDDVNLNNATQWVRLTWDDTNSYWVATDNATFFSGTFNGDLSVTGNLGVGTTDPEGKLHVKDDTSSAIFSTTQSVNKILLEDTSGDTAEGSGMAIDFEGVYGALARIAVGKQNAGTSGGSRDFGKIGFYTNSNDSYDSYAALTEVMTIDGAKVGMGTDSPEEALHVSGGGATHAIIESYSTDDGPSLLRLRKSYNATVGTKTVTVDGQTLGGISFMGVNTGLNFDTGGDIRVIQNGNATAATVPADMVFRTWGDSAVNADQLVLHHDGNVGIGGDPSNNLHIHTDASGEGILIKSTGDTYNDFIFDSNRTDAIRTLGRLSGKWDGNFVANISFMTGDDTTNKDDGQILFYTAPDSGTGLQTRMTIDSSGNVGIGTDNPDVKLDIELEDSATTTASNILDITHNSTGTTGVGFGNTIRFLGERHDGVLQAMASISSATEINVGGTMSSNLIFSTAAAGSLSPAMTINRFGNVGIGTASPKASFHIQDSAVTNAHYPTNASAIIEGSEGRLQLVAEESGTGGASLYLTRSPSSGDNYHWGINHHTDGSLNFGYKNTTATGQDLFTSSPAMTIDSSGSVIVGNPTGGGKGAGTINAVAVYDDNVLLTDFVFEDNYQYMSISEMEQFYTQEKHLPTIKGRKDWEQDGKFSVGQLSNMLWETTEVQARYIAELNNNIQELNIKHKSKDIEITALKSENQLMKTWICSQPDAPEQLCVNQ